MATRAATSLAIGPSARSIRPRSRSVGIGTGRRTTAAVVIPRVGSRKMSRSCLSAWNRLRSALARSRPGCPGRCMRTARTSSRVISRRLVTWPAQRPGRGPGSRGICGSSRTTSGDVHGGLRRAGRAPSSVVRRRWRRAVPQAAVRWLAGGCRPAGQDRGRPGRAAGGIPGRAGRWCRACRRAGPGYRPCGSRPPRRSRPAGSAGCGRRSGVPARPGHGLRRAAGSPPAELGRPG